MNEDIESIPKSSSKRVTSSVRLTYQAQVDVIQKQIGDLEMIRSTLGLSQRKMAQLLLVDPSSWSRWTQKGDEAPPHIYRALQWYMILQEKIPGLNSSYFLQKDISSIKKDIEATLTRRMDALVFNSASENDRFEGEILDLKRNLKDAHEAHRLLSKRFKRLYLVIFLGCLASILVFIV
jgi:transcriptional regulator with XRE-family HTH domain